MGYLLIIECIIIANQYEFACVCLLIHVNYRNVFLFVPQIRRGHATLEPERTVAAPRPRLPKSTYRRSGGQWPPAAHPRPPMH